MTADTLRLSGIVEASPRGPLLRVEDGTIWRIIVDADVNRLLGRAVIVEGVQQGSAIDVYYVGPVSRPLQRAAEKASGSVPTSRSTARIMR